MTPEEYRQEIDRLKALNLKLSRRIHFQRKQLHWLHRWMCDDLQDLRRTVFRKTLISSPRIVICYPESVERQRKVWEAVQRRIKTIRG
jgi:hypothetical protein